MGFSERRVVVIGAGHMGNAIVAGLVKNAGSLPLVVVETTESRRRAIREEFGIQARQYDDPGPADVIILAVQPQQFEAFAACSTDPDGTLHWSYEIVEVRLAPTRNAAG